MIPEPKYKDSWFPSFKTKIHDSYKFCNYDPPPIIKTSFFFLLASTAQDAATRIIQNNVIISNI